jgi:hypothetical protein
MDRKTYLNAVEKERKSHAPYRESNPGSSAVQYINMVTSATLNQSVKKKLGFARHFEYITRRAYVFIFGFFHVSLSVYPR